MSTRKSFIATAVSVPLMAAAPATPPAKPAAAPPGAATPPPKSKISASARALAENMRAFDASLTDKQITTIAAGVDDNLKVGERINPKGRALKNWDEPSTVFEVPE